MNARGQTVCLNMIVKDEAHVIGRCLATARPLIDAWVVSDTGSTDGTQALIRELLADLPGTLLERPWVDFAHNRTEVLDASRGLCDYSLIIDADDMLEIDDGFALPALDADAYSLRIGDASLSYHRKQLVRSAASLALTSACSTSTSSATSRGPRRSWRGCGWSASARGPGARPAHLPQRRDRLREGPARRARQLTLCLLPRPELPRREGARAGAAAIPPTDDHGGLAR